jgi:hypothetical protein
MLLCGDRDGSGPLSSFGRDVDNLDEVPERVSSKMRRSPAVLTPARVLVSPSPDGNPALSLLRSFGSTAARSHAFSA